jgi:hypothetical protein
VPAALGLGFVFGPSLSHDVVVGLCEVTCYVSSSDPLADDGPRCDVVSYISLFTNCCCYGVCIGT